MDVSNLKPTEFFVNIFGIGERRIQQLAQENIIPSVKEKGRYYFDPPIAIKKYITFLQIKKFIMQWLQQFRKLMINGMHLQLQIFH